MRRFGGYSMTLEELKGILAERGLRVVLNSRGEVRLRGDASTVTDTLRAVLQLHRTVLQDELYREYSRRVVRGDTGEVLGQWKPGEDWAQVAAIQSEHPGVVLRLEQYQVDIQGRGEWLTFAEYGIQQLPGDRAGS